MKNLFKIFVSVSFSILIFNISTTQVNAGDAWVKTPYCDKSLGLDYIYNVPIVTQPFTDAGEVITDSAFQRVCVNTNYVESINDHNLAGVYAGAGFCYYNPTTGDHLTTAENNDKNLEWWGTAPCCPYLQPNISTAEYRVGLMLTKTLYVRCCKDAGTLIAPDDGGQWDPEFKCPGYETPVVPSMSKYAKAGSDKENPVESSGAPIFPDAGTVYSCPESACFTLGTALAPAGTKRINLTEAQKAKYGCYPSLTMEEIAKLSESDSRGIFYNGGEALQCYDGKLIPKADLEKWGILTGLYVSCMAFPDVSEQNTCKRCYEPCLGANHTSCPLVYNSVGCIDTNPQGLITRVFQIGIGIIGAVGMVRVMQAAFMRQSGEPAKIKESYEIINSVIIGAVLLVFGVIILRFIGVNVLQILPSDFLQ